jgi:bifunctional protein TilS/HprT
MLDESLLDKNRKYLVGVSGGVDSMALLDMLVKKAYNVIVVHYNYHFREDSDLDENLVRSYCQNHHLPFYVRQGDKKEYQKGNFEMLAREKRYAFYKEIGDLNGIDTIILGHHLNDHLETIVMQLQRHNTKGYLGIKEQSACCKTLIKVKKTTTYRLLY